MVMHPPGRSHNLSVPSSTSAHARTSSLGDAERGDCLLWLMILDNSRGRTMQLSMHIQVPFPATTGLVLGTEDAAEV